MIYDIKGITTNMEGIYQLNFLAFLDLHLIYRSYIFFHGALIIYGKSSMHSAYL